MTKLAIFDFDGTIYKKETFNLLMEHLKKFPKRYKKFYRTILPIYVGYKIKLIPEKKMKNKLMYHYTQALDGFIESDITAFFNDVFVSMQDDFNHEVIQRMKEHQQTGYITLIVSGAFTPLLKAVDRTYPVDKIIGTDIPLLGQAIDHVHAERKVDLIQEMFQSEKIDWQESFAYGDSISDLSVLELVGNPVAVVPDEKLEKISRERNWEIMK